jgi:hypothetical protein
MSQLTDLLALCGLAAVAGAWLKSTRARERAVDEARSQCAEHNLQLLDESVGLNGMRLRRVGGRRQLEWGYAFEVSANGDDRMGGRLWMHGNRVVAVSLPSPPPSAGQEPAGQLPPTDGKVVPLRPRIRH